jgi:hypothetical protein
MSQFLSVDVDYWAALPHPIAAKEMNDFFNRVIKIGKPIYIVKDHEELVPFIDKLTWAELVNVDYHSDITSIIDVGDGKLIGCYEDPKGRLKLDAPQTELNCGTWVNYVKGASYRRFRWLYPVDHCYDPNGSTGGRCEEIPGFWRKPVHNTHNWFHISCAKSWKRKIKWDSVCGVGISLSDEWLNDSTRLHFLGKIFPKLAKAGAKSSMPLSLHLGEGRLQEAMDRAKDLRFIGVSSKL